MLTACQPSREVLGVQVEERGEDVCPPASGREGNRVRKLMSRGEGSLALRLAAGAAGVGDRGWSG